MPQTVGQLSQLRASANGRRTTDTACRFTNGPPLLEKHTHRQWWWGFRYLSLCRVPNLLCITDVNIITIKKVRHTCRFVFLCIWVHLWALNIGSICRSYNRSYVSPSVSWTSFLLLSGSAASPVCLSPLRCYLYILHLLSSFCSSSKPCGSVRETARLREVISSSKQTAALYNMLTAYINLLQLRSTARLRHRGFKYQNCL